MGKEKIKLYKTANPALHPIAARWAAPGELFARHINNGEIFHSAKFKII
jgi:hypothetical protein